MGKMQVRQEARALQGKSVQCDGRKLHISGGSSAAEFEMGSEGLVHLAIDESTSEKFRIKCFWEPDERRRQRSERLVKFRLPDLKKSRADALGGAPFGMLPALGPCTPFAVVMKNVRGENWKKLRTRVEMESQYPPGWWPAPEIRATWGYGLATAVMKMEARGFIHADLSPGNVVLNDGFHGNNPNRENVADGAGDSEDEAGDMALVDFDRYVHLPGDLPEPGQGSPGYAAPEIWQKQVPSVGSDRTALAILIQEFLVVGDPDISREESLNWAYDQEARCFEWTFTADGGLPVGDRAGHGDAHPLLERKYPELAKLVRATLAASGPMSRTAPEAWRPVLLDMVEPAAGESKEQFRSLLIEADPVPTPALRLAFGASKDSLDLFTTGFGIHASLERDSSGSIFVAVHNQAGINIKMPGSSKWTRYSSGARVRAEIGMVLFDYNGKCNARFDRPR